MKKSYWPDLTEVPRSLAQRFRKRFTFVVVELAGADIDFTVLLNMAEAARNAGAASGDFRRVNLDATELSLAVSIAAISSTLARTELAGACRAERTLRVDVVKKIGGVTCFEPKWSLGIRVGKPKDISTPSQPALRSPGLTLARVPNAERIVYKNEVDGHRNPVGKPLVAKASRYVEDVSANIEFHRAFCRTQNRAARFAAKFNLQLDSLGLKSTPRIHFLECKYAPFGGMVRYAAFS